MANNINQQAAPVAEQTVSQSEAFFLKYKKAIIAAVIAVVVSFFTQLMFLVRQSRRQAQLSPRVRTISQQATIRRLSMATAPLSRVS